MQEYRKEGRAHHIRGPQPLLLHLVTPGIDLLPGDLVALSYLRDRRLIGAHRHDNLKLLLVAPAPPSFKPKYLTTHRQSHLRYVANDVVKHVS
jgi:hypothetical protein